MPLPLLLVGPYVVLSGSCTLFAGRLLYLYFTARNAEQARGGGTLTVLERISLFGQAGWSAFPREAAGAAAEARRRQAQVHKSTSDPGHVLARVFDPARRRHDQLDFLVQQNACTIMQTTVFSLCLVSLAATFGSSKTTFLRS